MVDFQQLRQMTLTQLNERNTTLRNKKIDTGLTSDEQLEFLLIGRVKREKYLEAISN